MVIRARTDSSPLITFCIATLNRELKLEKTLQSIVDNCAISYKTRVLSQGPLTANLSRIAEKYEVELSCVPVNIGCGPARHFLTKNLSTRFAMTLDDDMYLTPGALEEALSVLNSNESLGAVSLPFVSATGRLLSPGGTRLRIRRNVIYSYIPSPRQNPIFAEVENLAGGTMVFKSQARKDFDWDIRFKSAFDDLDKSLQIWRGGKWKQAVLFHHRLIHDSSRMSENSAYSSIRYDWTAIGRSYEAFRNKWNLRLDLRTHLLYKTVLPALSRMPSLYPLYILNKMVQDRQVRAVKGTSL